MKSVISGSTYFILAATKRYGKIYSTAEHLSTAAESHRPVEKLHVTS